MKLAPALLLLAISLSTPGPFALAQRVAPPPPPPDPLARPPERPGAERQDPDTVRLGVELVQIDVVVTDKKGKKVEGLRKEDFEVYENGQRQEITYFNFVEGPKAVSGDLKRTGDDAAPAPPPRKLEAKDVRRVFALVVDDLFISFEHVKGVKTALRKFVEEQMRPGDLVAVILTSKGTGSLQQFTSDKRLLMLAIDRIQWNPRGARGLRSFDTYGQDLAHYSILRNRWDKGLGGIEPSDQKVPSNAGNRGSGIEMSNDFRDELYSVGSLGALDFVVRSLAGLPGRKSLVWFTEGFELYRTEREDEYGQFRRSRLEREERRSLELTRQLADRTNRAGVVFYPVDVRGVTVPYLLGADADAFDMPAQSRQKEIYAKGNKLRDSQDVMYFLANQTGGLVYAANDPLVGIRRAVADQESYYFIGYVPEKSSFASADGKPKYNDIQIKVKRPDLKVRSRSGFYGVEGDGAAAPKTPAERLAAAITSPVAAAGVDVTLSTQFLRDEQKGPVVRAMLHVDAADLTFAEGEGGQQAATFDVVAFASGESGQMESVAYETQTFRVPAAELGRLREHGLVYTVDLPIAAHGPYQIRAAVRDASTERIGSASEFVIVPSPDEERLAVSGLAVKGEPSLFQFFAGSEVTYFFAVYNAKLDPAAGAPRLRQKITIWRDGQQVFAGEETPLELRPQADWKRINAVGSFRLSERMEPGEYTLQIDVVDPLASKKQATATQWVAFEVVQRAS